MYERLWVPSTSVVLIGVLLSSVVAVAAAGDSASVPWVDASRASPAVGSDFRISGPGGTGAEWAPRLAYNSTTNQYLVVWGDGRSSATRGYDIYGRRVAADGSPVGADFRISGPGATSDEWSAVATYNPTSNQYLVVWQDERSSATRGSDVYGRRVAANGSPAGGDFRISGPLGISAELSPTAAYNSTTNQYLVVWADGRSSATRGSDIYGRRVAADGSPVGADFRISGPGATSDEWWAAVAYDSATDQYLVVWDDGRNSATRGSDIYGRRVAANGAPVGADFQVSGQGGTADEWSPAVAHNPTSNQFLVVRHDERKLATRGPDIYGRRIAADGSRAGADFLISGPGGTSFESSPTVAYNPTANQYLVVWDDGRNEATLGVDIYGRLVGG